MSLSVDIEKRLGSFRLRVKFEAEDGATALLGASGSGKSLTLRCIAGILTPDRGRIVLNGRVLFDSEAKIDLPPQERRVGYLFQQYALFPTMTVEKNLLCALRGRPKEERRARLAEALRRFRLEGLEKKYPAQLSGGEQQRTALARILCTEPEAILLDEPFSALDGFLRWELESELGELLAAFDGPILWVSHDLGECRRNCQSVCVLEHGAAGEMTTMEELLRHPATVGAARLAGCRNFLCAEAKEGGVYLPEWGLTLPVETNGRSVSTLAVPNEAIALGGALRFAVVRARHDVGHELVFLRPEGAGEDAPLLCASLPEGALRAGEESVSLTLRAEGLLLY